MDKHDLRKLVKDRSSRWGSQIFFVDGVNFVHQAQVNNWEIDSFVYVEDKIDTDFKRRVLESTRTRHFPVGLPAYALLTGKNDIQGLGAVVKMKYTKNALLPEAGIVLENIQYAGNLGTIVRTAVGLGIKNIYLAGKTVDPFAPEVIRASMGAIFSVNLVFMDNLVAFSPSYKNIALVLDKQATSLKDFTFKFSPQDNVLLWAGSEGRGLTPQAVKLASDKLFIPISNQVDSLNISEAVAIALYSLLA